MSDERMYGYIVKTPGLLSRKPRIDGTRIRVEDIANNYEHWGMSPDEICDAYPGITLAQVHAALAYYYDHREEILAEIEADNRHAEDFKRQHPESVR
jgi:uncharacterized protein (DUF433 family)